MANTRSPLLLLRMRTGEQRVLVRAVVACAALESTAVAVMSAAAATLPPFAQRPPSSAALPCAALLPGL
jgi:hypothetical protein